ncbi:MerR family transcriptional regulator [Bacillaceae bacterium SIJ1]|uniref:MerR family transcriptional regulator n=1 Tax=Litoribacterium kuwaitense TaxID=1398745 RepID=UPI0013EBED8F|nr:MerR family transcriptional regulator [Litoribacterium kuwaitense]NGP46180.1 MerR family transcriptional regulator [Litoribacterium kuwaitense]
MSNKYFRTGDIAKFNNVSADTVRYYDKENLVTPTEIRDNKYRYYTLNDALKFNNVTLLRELNVPLQQIKEWLTYTNLDQATSFNDDYIDTLKEERRIIDQKIHFLQEFNDRMESFKINPNAIEYVENDFIYICRALSFTADDKGFNIDDPIQAEGVDDPFWTKTSILGFMNTIEHRHSPNKGRVCCSNIIPSECDDIEKVHFVQALRFNYIGNPFNDPMYLSKIITQAEKYADTNNTKPINEYYEMYYMHQFVNDSPLYYVHIYFPID